jgi:hypothetical protein
MVLFLMVLDRINQNLIEPQPDNRGATPLSSTFGVSRPGAALLLEADMMREHRTTMYRQGDSWVVSRWDESVSCYRLSEGKTYWQAREICGNDNRRTPKIARIVKRPFARACAGAAL